MRLSGPLERDNIVNGDGLRAVLWTQGCPNHCPGCQNPETWAYDGGMLVDIEDVINDEPISSDKMLNFIIEDFEIGLYHMVAVQRLFICIIKEVLEEYGIAVKRSGDDLFYEGRKLSVSIATKSITSSLIHTALNIVKTGAPINVSSLTEMGIADIKEFSLKVMKKFTSEVEDMNFAKSKVRGVF